ncbi:protocatechuate 4,5-dioxygenase beta chain [Sphingomonas vulcanisoli]|uniref:Protocatechuate 4,5-dioxygenase beta chain n=1 Tax=Sphingomonas vulcanisoli TaxID=1658060 RepID=A0ABX0U025_9SPHN|nr:hypothetical protein [Sphingomonas vulcanisoli]NIJ09221.1 protocatechuate 4,5-dioxygenase beta chain [Sphingomonas vulcanisoli]
MYLKTESDWNRAWELLSLDRGVPQPASVELEDGPKLREYISRIDAGHAELKRQFDLYDPDICIIIGGDQNEMFDRSNVPQLMFFLGEREKAEYPGGPMPAKGQPYSPRMSNLPPMDIDIDVEFSKWLLDKLVKQEGFDIAFSYEAKPLARGHGLSHAFGNPASYLFEGNNTPTVIIYENTFDAPSLSAKRCYDLGAAIARLTRHDPRKIAIVGSGGLNHDPGGKRSGWIDEPMDRWFLEQLAQGNGRATQALYTFDSDTMVAGTGETRAWITTAGAMEEMGSRATILDYMPVAKGVTGLGLAYWLTDQQEHAVAAE